MRHSLGGTDGLREDPVLELLPDHPTCGQVDAPAQEPLELMLHSSQTKVADGPVEVRDQVDVAVRPRLVSSDGTEYQDGRDAEPPDLVAVGSEELQDVGTSHADILGPGVVSVGRGTIGWGAQTGLR